MPSYLFSKAKQKYRKVKQKEKGRRTLPGNWSNSPAPAHLAGPAHFPILSLLPHAPKQHGGETPTPPQRRGPSMRPRALSLCHGDALAAADHFPSPLVRLPPPPSSDFST